MRAEPLAKRRLRPGSEHATNLAVICVDVLHLVPCRQVHDARRALHRGGYEIGQIVQRARFVGADVEHVIAGVRHVYRLGYQRSHVIDVTERARLRAVAEDRHRPPLEHLVHEDADHVAIAIADVLARTEDVVRAEDDVVEPEHLVTARRSSSTAYLAIPYGSSGCGTIASVMGSVGRRAVDSDRRGEHEGANAGVHRRVHKVDGADDVVGVVEAPDEVAQAFGGIRRQVVDVREPRPRQTPHPRATHRRCYPGRSARPRERCRGIRRSGRRAR